jgi:hypothetical protein
MARLHLLPISQINGKVSRALSPRTNRCTLRVLTVPLQVAAGVQGDKNGRTDLTPCHSSLLLSPAPWTGLFRLRSYR